MTDVTVEIGGRSFRVACEEGQEPFLRSAAAMLDEESAALATAMGRLPEAQMLLMSGLMLADRTADLVERLRQAEERAEAQDARIRELEDRPLPAPQRVEVPVEKVVERVVEVPAVPEAAIAGLRDLADRAEALAARAADGR